MPEKVVVVGLGFVGQPLALSFARRGVAVSGLDVSASLVADLGAGISRLYEEDDGVPIADILKEALRAHLFSPTTDPAEAYRDAGAVLIAVGIPVTDGRPDERPLERAFATLAEHVQPGTTVILRTTVPPGTTARSLRRALERKGLRIGQDVFLAFVPERLSEGHAFAESKSVPILIGAPDAASRQKAREVMGKICDAAMHETDTYEAAELSKLLENAQRDVNIAVTQEAARLTEAMGLDIREVIRLASTHPRVRLLDPGPGVGGFCIPNAFRYMDEVATRLGVPMPTFAAARRTNDAVPRLLVQVALDDLGDAPPEGVNVGVLGLAMKDDSVDDRQSPAVWTAEALLGEGFSVRAYDPLVKGRPYQVDSLEEAVSGARFVYYLVRQPGIPRDDAAFLSSMAKGGLVIDARGTLGPRRDQITSMGLRLWSL